MLQNGPNDFLPFYAELVYSLRKVLGVVLSPGFHVARGLFKFTCLSTPVARND
jgi:hypothetical protein